MENKTPLVANFNVPLENVSQELNDFADLFARKAERLYLARSNIENFEFNTGTIFHYGDIKDNFTIPGLIDRRIDDQLALLYQRDNVFYVVVSGYLDIILPTSQWNGFAQLVRSKLNRSIIADVSIVIVTIPAKFNRIYYGDFYDQMPGISFDESTIDGERLSAVFGSIKKSYQVITQGFKFCRKKVDTYILSRYANGTLDDIVVHRDKEAGVGIEANIEIVLRSNIYFDLINALEVPKRSIWVYSAQNEFGYSIPNENYFVELLSYELQKNDYLYQAEITSESPTSWKTIPVEENFVENSIPEIYFDYLNNLAFTDPISKWFFKLGIILEESPIDLNPITLGLSFIEFIRDDLPPDSKTDIRAIRSSDTYGDMIFEVFDPIVYTTVNILGMIPAVDNIADCIGLAYATVRGNEDEIINYSIGMALVGVGTAGVKIIRESITPIKNAIVSARGATFIALANSAFLPVKARNSFRMIAFSTAMRIDPDQVIQLSENFYQAAINKAFHNHQIRIIYHAAEANKLTYLKLLDKEGTDIYAHIRRPELQQIQNIADNLLDAKKRVHLSDILKSMDNATLNQLEKDLTGEGGEALRALFGEKVGCVRAWESLSKGGVEDVIRRNTDYLKNIDDYAVRSGKHTDEIFDIAKNNENGVEQFFDELENTPASGYWDLNPFQRGKKIEIDLNKNLPDPYKTIDKYDNGIAISIKSLDVDAKTYQNISKLKNRLKKYIDDLHDFQGYSMGGWDIGNVSGGLPINSKRLDLAIPHSGTPTQVAAFNDMITYAASKNVNLNIIIFP